jgi:hypothetical protein
VAKDHKTIIGVLVTLARQELQRCREDDSAETEEKAAAHLDEAGAPLINQMMAGCLRVEKGPAYAADAMDFVHERHDMPGRFKKALSYADKKLKSGSRRGPTGRFGVRREREATKRVPNDVWASMPQAEKEKHLAAARAARRK